MPLLPLLLLNFDMPALADAWKLEAAVRKLEVHLGEDCENIAAASRWFEFKSLGAHIFNSRPKREKKEKEEKEVEERSTRL